MLASSQALDDGDQGILHACDTSGTAALDLLYANYAGRVHMLCMSRLRHSHDAEDVCHEVMLKAAAALPRFRSGERLWPWLATIAANACIDVQRRRARQPDCYADIDDETPGPEEQVDRWARVGIVNDALAAVPEPYRTSLYLREIEGWSYEEIAQLEGRTVPSVRTILFRGRQLLRNHIELVARRQGRWPLLGAFPVLPGVLRRRSSQARSALSQMASSGAAHLDAASGLLQSGAFIQASLGVVLALVTIAPPFGAATAPQIDPVQPISVSQHESRSVPPTDVPMPDGPEAPSAGGFGPSPTSASPTTLTPSVTARPAAAPAAPVDATLQQGEVDSGGDEHTVVGPSVGVTPTPSTPGGVPPVYAGRVGLWCPPPEQRSPTMAVVCAPLDPRRSV